MDSVLQSLREMISSLATKERVSPEVVIHRYECDTLLPLASQSTFAYLVVEGSVQITTAQEVLQYAHGQYFLSSTVKHSPAHVVALANRAPHQGLKIEVPTEDVVSVMLEMDVNFTTAVLEQSAATECLPCDHPEFLELMHRVLKVELESRSNAFMRRHLRRELAYSLITGPQGSAFVQDVVRTHNAKEIYTVNDWIKANYRVVFAVDDLADQVNMSVSTFHKKFKAAVGMGPLQCQKQLRLAEARRLMLNERMSVTGAAFEVGYESLSQFSREYRKMFGSSAQEDIRDLRNRHLDA